MIKWILSFFKRNRVSGVDPRGDVPCEWCKNQCLTTINEIWSEAKPEGRLVRLCKNCLDGCA